MMKRVITIYFSISYIYFFVLILVFIIWLLSFSIKDISRSIPTNLLLDLLLQKIIKIILKKYSKNIMFFWVLFEVSNTRISFGSIVKIYIWLFTYLGQGLKISPLLSEEYWRTWFGSIDSLLIWFWFMVGFLLYVDRKLYFKFRANTSWHEEVSNLNT